MCAIGKIRQALESRIKVVPSFWAFKTQQNALEGRVRYHAAHLLLPIHSSSNPRQMTDFSEGRHPLVPLPQCSTIQGGFCNPPSPCTGRRVPRVCEAALTWGRNAAAYASPSTTPYAATTLRPCGMGLFLDCGPWWRRIATRPLHSWQSTAMLTQSNDGWNTMTLASLTLETQERLRPLVCKPTWCQIPQEQRGWHRGNEHIADAVCAPVSSQTSLHRTCWYEWECINPVLEPSSQ